MDGRCYRPISSRGWTKSRWETRECYRKSTGLPLPKEERLGEPGAHGQEVGVVTEGPDAVVTPRKVPFPGAFGHRPRFAGRDLAWTSCRMGLSGGRRTGMVGWVRGWVMARPHDRKAGLRSGCAGVGRHDPGA
jgi:hypothetical protein